MRPHANLALVSSLLVVLGALLGLPACGGGDGGAADGGSGQLVLSVTDAPFPLIDGCLAAALVEIDAVSARQEGGGWVDVPLGEAAGGSVEIDVLDLRAGVADQLALGDVPTGAYSEVRLHVAAARLEFTDGSPARSFTVPSGMASGLKLKVDPPVLLVAGQTANLMLDIDVSESFHTAGLGGEPTCDDLKDGHGKVIFAPVVRVVNTDTSGLVLGIVRDDAEVPQGDVEVTAFEAGTSPGPGAEPVVTTFSAPPGVAGVAEGAYALWLEPGTYDLYVRAQGADIRTLAASSILVGPGAIVAGTDLTLPGAP
jgi:hypothetical protein